MKDKWEANWADYYKILQVHFTAEPEVIKAAYSRLSRKYHPDINPDPMAMDRMKELNEAYDILGNQEKRSKYDNVYLARATLSTGKSTPTAPLPKPAVDPPFLRFTELFAGATARQVFIIRNTGGPCSRISLDHASPWLRILRQSPVSGPERLPLQVEIEVQGGDWGKRYIENLIVSLDQIETHMRVEVQMAQRPRGQGTVHTVPSLEPRCPCILLLETSKSVARPLLDEVLTGLRILKESLVKDRLASKRVELAIITFDDSVFVVQGLVLTSEFTLPNLTTGRSSQMAAGINKALDMIESRKQQYQLSGIRHFRPWIFMISGGGSEGESMEMLQEAGKRISIYEREGQIAFFAVGVGNADIEVLGRVSVRTPLRLKEANILRMFQWLGQNLSLVCGSKPGDEMALRPVDWGKA